MLLPSLPAGNGPCPPGLEIRQVGDAASLAAYQAVFAEAYVAPAGLSERAFSDAVAARPEHTLYVGFHEGNPVSIANRVTSQGLAGIYAVGTIPSHRRRGYGAALVKRAAADGRAEGCAASCLQSWEMGVGVYQGIGYRTVVTYRTWSGPTNYAAPGHKWEPRRIVSGAAASYDARARLALRREAPPWYRRTRSSCGW